MAGSTTYASLEKKDLIQQLDNFKLITRLNVHLFTDDCLVKEQLCSKLQVAESILHDLDHWRRQGDCGEYNRAITEANTIIYEIRVILLELLDP